MGQTEVFVGGPLLGKKDSRSGGISCNVAPQGSHIGLLCQLLTRVPPGLLPGQLRQTQVAAPGLVF